MHGQIDLRQTVLVTLLVLAAALAALGGGRDGAAAEEYPLPDQKSEVAFTLACWNAGGDISFGTISITCTKGDNWVSCQTGSPEGGGSATDCSTNVPPPQRGGAAGGGFEAGRGAVVGADPAPEAETGNGGRGGAGRAETTAPGTIVATDGDPGTPTVPAGDPGSVAADGGAGLVTRTDDGEPAPSDAGAAPADPVEDPAADEAATTDEVATTDEDPTDA